MLSLDPVLLRDFLVFDKVYKRIINPLHCCLVNLKLIKLQLANLVSNLIYHFVNYGWWARDHNFTAINYEWKAFESLDYGLDYLFGSP